MSLLQRTEMSTGSFGKSKQALLFSSRSWKEPRFIKATSLSQIDRRGGLSGWVCDLLSFCFLSFELLSKAAFSFQSSQKCVSENIELYHVKGLSQEMRSCTQEWNRSFSRRWVWNGLFRDVLIQWWLMQVPFVR